MALSANVSGVIWIPDGEDRQCCPATNGVTFYAPGLMMIDTATGYMVKPANTATFRFLGILERKVVGDTSATPVPEGEVNVGGGTLKAITVTGVSAITHNGDPVYPTNGDDDPRTMKIATESNLKPFGYIRRWYSGTTCDVAIRSHKHYMSEHPV